MPPVQTLAGASKLDRLATYAAWFESNTDVDFPGTTSKIKPLILGGRVLKVWGEAHTSHKGVVPHIVRDSISTPCWFLRPEVALNRHL